MPLAIFLLLFGSAILATLFLDVVWGIYFYSLLYFINPYIRWWYTIPVIPYHYIIAIVFLVSYLFRFNRYHTYFKKIPQTKWLTAFYIGMVIISFYALWPEEHDKMLLQMSKNYVFLIIAFIAIDNYKKFEKLIWTFIAGSFYISYYAKYVAHVNSFGRIEHIGVVDGANSDTTAAVLIASIPFLIGYLLTGKRWQKVISAIFLAFIVNGTILLNSRGAFVGIAVGFFYFVYLLFHSKMIGKINKAYIAGVIIVVLLGASHLTDNVFWSRMSTMNDVQVGEGGATRVLFWLKSIEVAEQYPFGTGVDGFEYLSPKILDKKYLSPKTGTRVIHSTYFEALSDFGFIGPILIFGLILSNILSLRRVQAQYLKDNLIDRLMLALSLEASYVAYLVAIIFINRLYSEVFFWFALYSGLLFKFYRIKQEEVVNHGYTDAKKRRLYQQ